MKNITLRYELAKDTKVMVDKRGTTHLYRRCPNCGALTSDRLHRGVRCHGGLEALSGFTGAERQDA